MNKILQVVVVGLIALGLISGVAYAELSVSVTISGPLEELLPLLQHIKDMGIGHGGGETGIKLEMNSVAAPAAPAPEAATQAAPPPAPEASTTAAAQPTPPPTAPPPPPKPALGFSEIQVAPSTTKPGNTVLISVRVNDPDHQVDTVSATTDGTVANAPGVGDLYDNGTHGDVTAADGIWSAAVILSSQVAPGEYPITIRGYNRNGLSVMVPGPDKQDIPLSAQAKITVTP